MVKLLAVRAGADVIYVAEHGLGQVSTALPGGPRPFCKVSTVAGLTANTEGNVYAASAGPPGIQKITPAGVASVYALGPGLLNLNGVAFDQVGNLYASTIAFGGSLTRINSGGNVTQVATGVRGLGLACDAQGNLFLGALNSVAEVSLKW